jgi:hypothetical protein
MTHIVTYIHRPKRAPRKRKAQAAAITGPTIVTGNGKRDRDQRRELGDDGEMLIRDIIERMRDDGCGGRASQVELLTGIEGASRRPVRVGRGSV